MFLFVQQNLTGGVSDTIRRRERFILGAAWSSFWTGGKGDEFSCDEIATLQ